MSSFPEAVKTTITELHNHNDYEIIIAHLEQELSGWQVYAERMELVPVEELSGQELEWRFFQKLQEQLETET